MLFFCSMDTKGIEQYADSYIKYESFSAEGKIVLTLYSVILKVMLALAYPESQASIKLESNETEIHLKGIHKNLLQEASQICGMTARLLLFKPPKIFKHATEVLHSVERLGSYEAHSCISAPLLND